jgi:tRNA dimethylallyltransferase
VLVFGWFGDRLRRTAACVLPVSTVPRPPVFLAGPTGVGKSAVAVELARMADGEVVNADAYQVYAGMPVLTAAPGAAELAAVPHHLVGVVPPSETCSAARFARMADGVIAGVQSRGKLPVVVGGSGLYLKALTHGLSPLPAGDAGLRAALGTMPLSGRLGWLKALDPAAAASIDPHNPRYIDRALEVCLLTGSPVSKLRRGWAQPAGTAGGAPRFAGAKGFALLPSDRRAHYARTDARVAAMVERGVLAEVAALPEGLSATASRAIGLAAFRAHLAGEISLAEAVAAVQQATRQYAKRQLTWFRRERFFQTVCLDPGAGAISTARRLADLAPGLLAGNR